MALGRYRCPISLSRSIRVAQNKEGFSNGGMFPVIVRLPLAYFQDGLGNAASFVGLFKEESYGGRIYSRIGIGRRYFESAIVVIKCFPKVLIVLGVGTPLVFIGPAQDT